MNKYKINYVNGKDKDINDIFIKVLIKDIQKYFNSLKESDKN